MSLKGDKYETLEEIKFRLEQTIVLYDGKPVYIGRVNMPGEQDAGEIARVYFKELPLKEGGPKEVRKYLSSRKFDLTPFKMGYFNHNGRAVFASRTPVRQNKQGLSKQSLVLKTLGLNPITDREVSFTEVVTSQGFIDMIEGSYPSFDGAVPLLKEDAGSVALSQSFALSFDDDLGIFILFHRGIKCGLVLEGDRGVRLAAKYGFLKEELRDHKIPTI